MTREATQNIPKYMLDDQVGYLLRLANQRHAAIFQKHAIENLTPTQFATIMRIHQYGNVSQNRLGRLAGMDVATIKGVVERLKAKRLVELDIDPQDRRRTLISLTRSGQDLIGTLEAMGTDITSDTLSPLTGAQSETLIKLLRKII